MEINKKKLISLIKFDDDSIKIVLETFKSGLFSKNCDICLSACKLLITIISDLIEMNLQPVIWEWFCKDSGGLSACVISVKKEWKMMDNIGNLMVLIGKDNISELLTIELKKILADGLQYINFVHCFLKVFNNEKTICLQVFFRFLKEVFLSFL